MKKEKPVVVGIGELLWDMLPDGKKAGGAPINFVYHAGRLGAEGYAISAVGDDPLGAEIISELDSHHIGHHIQTVDRPTGRVMVELRDGEPSYTIMEDVAWDHIPLSRQAVELLGMADAVCFGTLAQRSPDSRHTIRTLLSCAPKESLRIFDVNIRQSYYSKEVIEASLRKANVFKVNAEELALLRLMYRKEIDEDELCRWFIRRFALRYLILTEGESGSTVYTATERSRIATPKVEVADTVGAGDAFSGAFACSILCGKSLREAHQTAVETAAFACTQHGAWTDYPNTL
jgi:fructokinase